MEPSKVVVYSLLETDIGTCSCSTLGFSEEKMRTKKQEIALSEILDLKIFGEEGMPPHTPLVWSAFQVRRSIHSSCAYTFEVSRYAPA